MAGRQIPEEDIYKKVLRKCYTRLVSDMEPRSIIDRFHEIEFLPYSTLRDIAEISTTSEKNRAIVDKVLTKGVRGYKDFKKCLKKTEQAHLADRLTEVENQHKQGAQPKQTPKQTQPMQQGHPRPQSIQQTKPQPTQQTRPQLTQQPRPQQQAISQSTPQPKIQSTPQPKIQSTQKALPQTTEQARPQPTQYPNLQPTQQPIQHQRLQQPQAFTAPPLLDTVNMAGHGEDITLPSEAANVPERLPDAEKLSNALMMNLSRKLGNEWKQVMLALGLKYEIFQQLAKDNPYSVQLQILSALYSWRNDCDLQIQAKQLFEALEAAGRSDLADEVRKEDKSLNIRTKDKLPEQQRNTNQESQHMLSNISTTHDDRSVREKTPVSTQISKEESTSDLNESLESLQLGATGNTQMQAPTPSMDIGPSEQELSRMSLNDLQQGGNNDRSSSNNNDTDPGSVNGHTQDTLPKNMQLSSGNQTGAGQTSVAGRSTDAHLDATPANTDTSLPSSNDNIPRGMKSTASDRSSDRNVGVDLPDSIRETEVETRLANALQTGAGPSVTGRSTDTHLNATPANTDTSLPSGNVNTPRGMKSTASDRSSDRNVGVDVPDSIRDTDVEIILANALQKKEDINNDKTVSDAVALDKIKAIVQEHAISLPNPQIPNKPTAEIKIKKPLNLLTDKHDGVKKTIIVNKCAHDGRLLTLDLETVEEITKNSENLLKFGGYGEVYKCGKDKKLEMDVVLKKIDYSNDGGDLRKSADNEIIAARVMHWAIAPMIGMLEDNQKKITYFMLPLLENGDLYHAIKNDVDRLNNDKPVLLDWYTRVKILYQIASAIQYLHTEVKDFRGSVIHRDVTSKNIVLDEMLNARLIDFGINVQIELGRKSGTMTNTQKLQGNPSYGTYSNISRVTRHNDWLYFGIVILEMLTSEDVNEGMLKDEKELDEENFLDRYQQDIDKVWPTKTTPKQLTTLAWECFKQEDVQGAHIVQTLRGSTEDMLVDDQDLVRTKTNDKYWTPPANPSAEKKCVNCMVNPTDCNILDHPSKCNMNICVACLRNSYLNPIECHTCETHTNKIESSIGTKWGAILIAGNDVVNAEAGKTFTDELKELKKILMLKHPMVVGMSEENVYLIHPSKPGEQEDTLKTKVIEAFDNLVKKADDNTVDTVMIYFSGHYKKENDKNEQISFQFGSDKDRFRNEEFEEEIGKLKIVKKVYVYLDCCCAPKLLPEFKSKIIQINASKSSEDTNVKDGLGSPFTQLFQTALIGKAHSKVCINTLFGLQQGNRGCEICERFCQECVDGFITVERMHTFISKHLEQTTPIVYKNEASTEDIRIGYFIETPTKLKFSMHPTHSTDIKNHWDEEIQGDAIPDTIEQLKCILLDCYLKKMAVTEANKIPVDKYCDIVAISVKTSKKKDDISELNTMKKIMAAWNGKTPLYARLRGVHNIRHGRVVSLLNGKIDAEIILEQYLKNTCNIKNEETHFVRLEYTKDEIFKLSKMLKGLKSKGQPADCPSLQYLQDVVISLIKMPTKDLKSASIHFEFPYVTPVTNKTVYKNFFVLTLVQLPKAENGGKDGANN